MPEFLQKIQENFAWLSTIGLIDYLVVAVGVLFWFFAPEIVQRFRGSDLDLQRDNRRRVIRAVAMYSIYFYVKSLFPDDQQKHWAFTAINFIAIAYLGYLTLKIADYYILRRFGNQRDVAGKLKITETYSSRLLSIIARMIIFIVVLVAEIRLLGYQSLLETGGAIGIIGVFLALTQSVWAPDIFGGLIILNSEMLEEDDVIEISEAGILGAIFKTKMFHTEILNMTNNHRVMIRNSKLRDYVIHNLSRFASAKGLRECLKFNIGYDAHEEQVRAMFQRAYQIAVETKKLPIEGQYEPEIFVENCGDYAVEWSIFYYVKEVKQILSVRKLFNEIILQESRRDKIALATPELHQHLPQFQPESFYPVSTSEKRLAEKLEKKRAVEKQEAEQEAKKDAGQQNKQSSGNQKKAKDAKNQPFKY